MPKIVVVGEAWGLQEDIAHEPFVGKSGTMLRNGMRSAGIDPAECLLTNTFNLRPDDNNIENLCGKADTALPGFPPLKKGKYIRAEFAPEIERLEREIIEAKPNLIIALGATACWAVLHKPFIRSIEGAPIMSRFGIKTIPAYHPAAVMRDPTLGPHLYSALCKASKEQHFPKIIRPSREYWLEPNLDDMREFFLRYLCRMNPISVDIETANDQVTCIGFGDHERVIVVPFVRDDNSSYWPTVEQEMQAWDIVKDWLGPFPNADTGEPAPKIGQNFVYDYSFLYQHHGIMVSPIGDDTFLMHHALHPELKRGLAVLATLYTSEPQWKFYSKRNRTRKRDG